MPPKKYTMDKLGKTFDEKLNSFKFDLVSALKKEIMNEVKATLSEKDKEIEVLKSQVTLLQNHVSTMKHALNKKVDELEQYGKYLHIEDLSIKLMKNLRKFRRKLSILKRSLFLFGNHKFSDNVNSGVMYAVLKFIELTNRFSGSIYD